MLHALRHRTRLVRVLQICVGAALLAILWQAADGREALRTLSGAAPGWILAAIGALTLQTFLSAFRWRLTARQLGIRVTPREAVREYYLSQIVNQSLPGGVVGDAGRAVRARAQAGLLRSSQAVILERLAGQAALFVVMAVSFIITLTLPGGMDWPRWVAFPLVLAILGVVALPPVILGAARLPGAAGRLGARFGEPVRTALLAPRVLPFQVALSLGTAACNLSAFAFCTVAIGADLPFGAAVALVPLILFTMLIPISVSGWGLREGAAAALFPLAGATATEGLAASVAFGLAFIVAVLPGVIPLWLDPGIRIQQG